MNTPTGRCRFKRILCGILSGQEVFHRSIIQHSNDIDHLVTDIDDILVWGQKIESHYKSLIASLEREKKIDLTININKCRFRQEKLVYLGQIKYMQMKIRLEV